MEAAVRVIWRSRVLSAHNWEIVADIPADPGEAGGHWVRCTETKRTAWLKPLLRSVDKPHAAREKIAADLACDLQLPVPPVLLHHWTMQGTGRLEPVCLSLVC